MDAESAQPWELLTETEAYDGYTRVRRDTYRLPDGSVSEWDVLEQGDTVAVVALTDAGDVILFEQYRVGPRALVRELPGGLIDAGEDALTAAARELLEETGHRAAALFHAGSEWSGANSTRRKNVVVAAGCRRVADPRWEEGETGVVRTIGVGELIPHLLAGDVSDAGEASRGLLVFARSSLTDPVLRRAQQWIRAALGSMLRPEPVAAPVDEFTLFWDRLDADDPAAARAELGRLLDARGLDDARAAFERASLHDALGEEDAAIPLYRQALERGLGAPQRTEAIIQLASSLRNVGDTSSAMALLRTIGDDDPLVSSARAFLALALHDDEKPTAAVRTALQTLAPTLPQYRRAVDAYAGELASLARIRAIAVGLLVTDGHVLLESYPQTDEHGEFLRAPGGGIEFGETAERAVVREFAEELAAELDDVVLEAVTENIFDGASGRGHEIVYVFRVQSPQLAALPRDQRLAVRDSHTTVGWYEIAALSAADAPAVYPAGVLDLLR